MVTERDLRESVDATEELEAVLAATVLVLRESAAATDGVEVLLVRRDTKLAFAAGMWVFPGGRVDADELDQSGDHSEALQRAAVREVAEESGLVIERDRLVTFSRWVTPPGQVRRFDTWFYATALSVDATDVVIDDGEIRDHVWQNPIEAIRRYEAGEVALAPPTYVTLLQLAAHGPARAHETIGAIGAAPTPEFHPVVCKRDDGLTMLYGGDAGYDTADPAAAGPRHRLDVVNGQWSYTAPTG